MNDTIKTICNRLIGLRTYSAKDKQIASYILDLIELYTIANSETRLSIISIADNYLIALESNFFSKFNNL